ncbi:hypothetical protein SEA_PHABULOSO_103 [Gordonia phage Phabuloso]|nr:hypothetical protein SEA_PHABULOSO_103 [Gordonia phage Phabuloso]
MTDSYTLTDLQMMRDLRWRSAGWYTSGGILSGEPRVSSLQYLIDKGYDPDKAADAAIKWDDTSYLTRYRPMTFDPGPELSRRDHLIQECGYDPEFVDTYLAEQRMKDVERARERAEREAYERTWRYKAITAWKEAQARVRAAWSILRHGEDDL